MIPRMVGSVLGSAGRMLGLGAGNGSPDPGSEDLAEVLGRWLPAAPALPKKIVPQAPAGEDVLDRDDLIRRLGGDEEMAQGILETFMRDAPNQLNALKQALEANDFVLAERQAHTIKGAADNIGAKALQNAGMKAQGAVKAGQPEEISRSVQAIESALTRARTLLRRRSLHLHTQLRHSS